MASGASGAAAPAAPSPSPPDGVTYTVENSMSFVGTANAVHFSGEGDQQPLVWHDLVATLYCENGIDGECAIHLSGGVNPEYPGNSGPGNVRGSRTWPALVFGPDLTFSQVWTDTAGTLCDDDNLDLSPTTLDIALEGDTLTIHRVTQPRTERCSDDHAITAWGTDITYVGTLFEGTGCLIDPAVCPQPSPSPSPSPEPVVAAPEPSDEPAAVTSVNASELDSGSASAPSVLSSLTTVQDLDVSIWELCLAALVTVILSLLVAFPKKLYASAISAAPKRWREFVQMLGKRGDPISTRLASALAPKPAPDAEPGSAATDGGGDPDHKVGSEPWLKAALGVIAAGLISAWVDPKFGLNWGSLRLSLSLSASFLMTVAVGWSVAIWLARRIVPGLAASYSFKPWTLLVVALSVLFTRLTGMEPGMVFGLVAGVALGSMASKALEAKVAVLQTGYAFAAGVVGWLLYSVISPAWPDANVFQALLLDTLAGLAVAGFAAAPLALLPVAGMGGSIVYDWNKRAWFGLYTVGLLGFFLVLMPMDTSWKEVDMSLKAWVGLYLAYTAVAVALYAAIVRPWERKAKDEVEAQGVEGE